MSTSYLEGVHLWDSLSVSIREGSLTVREAAARKEMTEEEFQNKLRELRLI